MTSRRDVLRALVGAPLLGHALAHGLVGGCGRRDIPVELAGELLGPDIAAGHRLRDGIRVEALSGAPTERVEVAILGGGPAGLSAAYRLARGGQRGVALYELEPVLGGTSRAGQSDVTPYPWGAHYLPLPMAHNADLMALLRDMNALESDTDGPEGAEALLVREPESRVFHQGYWERGLYPYGGASPEDLRQLRRFRARVDDYVRFRDASGKRAFSIPSALASTAPEILALDQISASAWLEREGFTSARLRWLADYACRDDYGLRADHASAWAMLFYWAARTPQAGEDTMDLLTWPEGNGALVRFMAERAERAGVRLACRQMAVEVALGEGGEGVQIAMLDLESGSLRRVVADRCIAAMPRFIANRVVRGLHERDRRVADEFRYGAWMVANLHVRERPTSRGMGPCWDNVIHDSPSLGYILATHQRGREVGPSVLTHYWPLATEDPAEGRRHLYEADHAVWRDAILADLGRAHPDLRSTLDRVDVFRWGHAMVQPRVGFVSSAARQGAQAPHGPVHFAHSDLSGLAIFEESFYHGARAADEVMSALRQGS